MRKKAEKKELKVEDIVNEIMEQAIKYYQKCQETGDWEAFGKDMEGLYRSYTYGVKPIYTEAMLMILKSNPKVKVGREIVGGNYGFKVQAHKASKVAYNDAILIKEKVGEDVARRYVVGMNPCDKYMIEQAKKAKEEIDDFVENAVRVI